jgi:predicted nucleotidyltransferase component of viral defense system
MNVSVQRLRDLSAETGFRPGGLEKVVRLGELAANISRHPLLGQALALKGGTALNLGFGPPPRLSVDIDLNYVADATREAMLRDRPVVERGVEELVARLGYQVQRSRADHAARKLFLRYRAAAGTPDRIEVDLNFLFRLPLGDVRPLALWQPGEFERPRIRVVPAEELIAGKLCALLARAAPRDLFDAIRLPSRLSSVWSTPKLRRLFVALGGTLDHPLHRYGPDRFARVDERVVREQLHPMLTSGSEPDAADLRRGAWDAVAPMLDLSEAEREYTDRLQLGDLRPELLFPDDTGMAERLGRHPALLWKAQNAREHAAGVRRGKR